MDEQHDSLDAYVFVASGSAATLEKLEGLRGEDIVRTVVTLRSGSFGALAFVEAEKDDFAGLAAKLQTVQDAVNPNTDTGIAVSWGPFGPTRWKSKPVYRAYTRIRVQPGHTEEVMDAITDRFSQDRFGSAVVAGSFDILLELGGDSHDEIVNDLLARVQTLPSIISTDSALAYVPD